MKIIRKVPRLSLAFLIIGFASGWVMKPRELTSPVTKAVDDTRISDPKRLGGRSKISAAPSDSMASADSRIMGIMNEDDPRTRARLWLDYVDSLQVDEFDQALGSLMFWKNAGGGSDLSLAVHTLLVRYGQEAPLDAIEYIGGLPHNDRWDCLTPMFEGWVEVDLNAASAYFRNPANAVILMDVRLGEALTRVIARTAAKVNLDDAMNWVSTLEGHQSPAVAFQEILQYVGRLDPASAAGLALTVDYGNQEEMVNETAKQWARQDPGAALQWAQSLSDVKLASQAIESAIGGWAIADVEAAGRYVEGTDYTGEVKLLRDITREWTAKDPIAASQWVTGLRESEAKDGAMRELIHKWAVKDPEYVSTWLIALPDGSSKDNGILGLSEIVVQTDPEAAMIWAGSISDKTFRIAHLQGLIRYWINSDGDAAYDWLYDSDFLPKEERQAVLDDLVSSNLIQGNVRDIE